MRSPHPIASFPLMVPTTPPTAWLRSPRSGVASLFARHRRRRVDVATLVRRWEAVCTPRPETADEWLVEEVTAFASAVVTGGPVDDALARLVARRYDDGWPLDVVLDDLMALRAALPRRHRGLVDWSGLAVRAGLCHADAADRDMVDAACREPLTGLPNVSFLTVVVEDLVEEASDDGYHLLHVTAAPPGHGLAARLAAAIRAAEAVRETVVRPCLVASVERDHLVAVLPPLVDSTLTRRAVEVGLARALPACRTDVWLAPLPSTLGQVADDLRDRRPRG